MHLFITTVILLFNSWNYPDPPVNRNSLFYIQRSKNTNAIVYELNRGSDGRPDPLHPVHIYWIRYSSDSTTAELTYIQDRFAYGVSVGPHENKGQSFRLRFNAYDKKDLYIMPLKNDSYGAFMKINGQMAQLKKIFISITGGTFWFPAIDYIELTGSDPETGATVIERFKP